MRFGRWMWILAVMLSASVPPLAADAPNAGGPQTAARPSHTHRDPLITRQRSFTIPFVVDSTAPLPLEVQLLVSTDGGATWTPYDRQHPSVGSFVFRAAADGHYCFASRTVDVQHRIHPTGPPRPELCVIVDSTPPVLELSAEPGRDGELHLRWRAVDPHLVAETFRISYRPAFGNTSQQPQWTDLAVDLQGVDSDQTVLAGEAAWWPQLADSQLYVRASIADRAGNQAVAVQPVTLRPISAQRQPPHQLILARTPSKDVEKQRADSPADAPLQFHWTTTPAASAEQPSVPAAQLQWTNATAIDLEYRIDRQGDAPIDPVVVWATLDSGATWRAWATDVDGESPVRVELPAEGIYGFQLNVGGDSFSNNNVPRPGSAPDIWIGVDRTAPVARIVAAPLVRTPSGDALQIQWTANDEHLAANPISLWFGPSPDGPWNLLAEQVPDSGRYDWVLPASLPDSLYLKLEVRDRAGNLGADQTTRPIPLPSRYKSGRITGFRPADSPVGQPSQ